MSGTISDSYLAGEGVKQDETQEHTDPLDLLVENILDIARENSIDEARIYIRDRIVKDAIRDLQVSGYPVNALEREAEIKPDSTASSVQHFKG